MNDSDVPNLPGIGAPVVSSRWADWRQRTDIDAYDARFEQMAASGKDVHGEADFLAALLTGSSRANSILDAGCGTGRIAIELARRGFDVVGVDLDADMVGAARRKAPDLDWLVDDLGRMQLSRRFEMIAMPGNVMIFCEPDDRRLIVHNMAQHLMPGGRLIAGFSLERGGYTLAEWDQHCAASGLVLEARYSSWARDSFAGGDYHVSVHRRTDRYTVHDLVTEARAGLRRMTPIELFDAIRSTPGIVVADTRQTQDRSTFGHIEGSVHLPRTVLEWRVDQTSGYSDPAITDRDQWIVVVCNDGYSSSIAAATLQRLGYAAATDLIGGFMAWRRAGLPIRQ